MIPELLLAVSVAVLLLYWLRYNCLAILRTATTCERVRQVAAANHLAFLDVEERLSSEPDYDALDALNGALRRDYHILTCLLRYSSGLHSGAHSFEQRMLMADFKFMQLRYALLGRLSAGVAQRSLAEQSSILKYFANAMGERSAAHSRA